MLAGGFQHSWETAAIALQAIANLPSIDEQIMAWEGNSTITARHFLIREVIAACRQVKILAPLLAKSPSSKRVEEDRLTAVLKAILDSRLLKLGWYTGDQGRRGLTGTADPALGSGGIGEIDLEIFSGRKERVALVEALVLGTRRTKYTQDHFKKVFSYSAGLSTLGFVIVWSYSRQADFWSKVAEDIKGTNCGKYPVRNASGDINDFVPLESRAGVQAFYTTHENEAESQSYLVVHACVDVGHEDEMAIGKEARDTSKPVYKTSTKAAGAKAAPKKARKKSGG
jgi:hypothetical protein